MANEERWRAPSREREYESRPGEHDPRFGVITKFPADLLEFRVHAEVDRVQLVRPVQYQRQHAIGQGREHSFGTRHFFLLPQRSHFRQATKIFLA